MLYKFNLIKKIYHKDCLTKCSSRHQLQHLHCLKLKAVEFSLNTNVLRVAPVLSQADSQNELTVHSLITASQHSRTHCRCGQSRCRYLVVPHADIGPDVIVDYRLLFIFRLQTHKIHFLWWNCDKQYVCSSYEMTTTPCCRAASVTEEIHTGCKVSSTIFVFTQYNQCKLVSCFVTHSWMSSRCMRFI